MRWSRTFDNADRNTVMDRDRRLTGYLRGQTDSPDAPPGFELNNPWRVRSPYAQYHVAWALDWLANLSWNSLRSGSCRLGVSDTVHKTLR